MDYYQVSLEFKTEKDYSDIVTAFLSQLPFESFRATEKGLDSFIELGKYKPADLEEVIKDIPFRVSHSVHLIERKNWNKEWEKNFDPTIINDRCIIRAPFHESDERFEYNIIIMPKMSFGTGHHATTALMIRSIMNEPLKGKRVLDAGCGTGVLSIMAEKLQAESVLAHDIDDWAVMNAKENLELNNCKYIVVEKGSIDDIQAKGFDVLLANINKNVLLRDIPVFAEKLKEGGVLFLSGFYENDCSEIIELADLNQLKEAHIATLDKWALIKLEKLM